jgi:hypothetical protein
MARQLRSSADMLRSQGPLSRSVPLGDGFKVSLSLPGDVRLTPSVVHDSIPGQKFDKDGALTVKCPDEPLYDDDGTPLDTVKVKGKRTGTQLQAAIRHRYGMEPAPSAAEKRAHAAPAANGK